MSDLIQTEKVTLPVKGMNCASCAITIEKTLKKVDGVINCEANYGNEKTKIEFDSSKTNVSELSKKIEPFGYSLIKQESANNKLQIQDNLQNPNSKIQNGHIM